MSQQVTMESTRFAVWMMHFFLTVFGGAFTGGLFGLMIQQITGDSGRVDIGVCALIGTIFYCLCFCLWVFVRTALGYEDY